MNIHDTRKAQRDAKVQDAFKQVCEIFEKNHHLATPVAILLAAALLIEHLESK